jgi:hypothetical protein
METSKKIEKQKKVHHPAIMSELLGISENSYFRWRAKDHIQLIKLIENSFDDDEILEFLQTNCIKRKTAIENHIINTTLMQKVQEKIKKYGISIESYIEYLVINDLDETAH